jgi:hypothetical protein
MSLERKTLSLVREALASSSSSSSQHLPALLMELRSNAETAAKAVAEQSAAEERARRQLAEADDGLRALKYQRAQIVRELAKLEAGSAHDIDEKSIISANDARRVKARVASSSHGADASPPATEHSTTIFRLGVERDERARLCGERDALLSKRESLAAAAKTAAELKAAVDTQLEAVVEVASKLGSALPVRPASGSRLPADLLELLPSPMYTLAIGLSANVCALRPDDTALSIVGDAAAARALATKGSGGGGGNNSGTKSGTNSGTNSGGGGGDSATTAHPLSLQLSLCGGGATVTFRWMPALAVLTAATEPASLEAALSHLDEDGGAGAPGVAGTAAAAAAGGVGGGGGAGSGYPDLSSLLRARRGESTQVQGSEALLPYRPYKWLQWLGGLGPLLTSRVKSSQPVLEALVQAVSTAAASGPKGSAGPTRKRK